MSVQSKFNALELLTRIRAANASIPVNHPPADSIQTIPNPEILGSRSSGTLGTSKNQNVNQSSSQNMNRESSSNINISGFSSIPHITESFSPIRNIMNKNAEHPLRYTGGQQSYTMRTSSPSAPIFLSASASAFPSAAGGGGGSISESVHENRRFDASEVRSLLNSPKHDDFIMKYKDTYDLEDDRNVPRRRERTGYDSLLQYNQDISQNIPGNKNKNQDQNKQSIKSELSHDEYFSLMNNNNINSNNFNFNKNRSNPITSNLTANYVTSSDIDTIPYNTRYNIPYDYSNIKNNSSVPPEIYEELNNLRIDNIALNRKIKILTIQKSEIERQNRETKIKNDDIIATLRSQIVLIVKQHKDKKIANGKMSIFLNQKKLLSDAHEKNQKKIMKNSGKLTTLELEKSATYVLPKNELLTGVIEEKKKDVTMISEVKMKSCHEVFSLNNSNNSNTNNNNNNVSNGNSNNYNNDNRQNMRNYNLNNNNNNNNYNILRNNSSEKNNKNGFIITDLTAIENKLFPISLNISSNLTQNSDHISIDNIYNSDKKNINENVFIENPMLCKTNKTPIKYFENKDFKEEIKDHTSYDGENDGFVISIRKNYENKKDDKNEIIDNKTQHENINNKKDKCGNNNYNDNIEFENDDDNIIFDDGLRRNSPPPSPPPPPPPFPRLFLPKPLQDIQKELSNRADFKKNNNDNNHISRNDNNNDDYNGNNYNNNGNNNQIDTFNHNHDNDNDRRGINDNNKNGLDSNFQNNASQDNINNNNKNINYVKNSNHNNNSNQNKIINDSNSFRSIHDISKNHFQENNNVSNNRSCASNNNEDRVFDGDDNTNCSSGNKARNDSVNSNFENNRNFINGNSDPQFHGNGRNSVYNNDISHNRGENTNNYTVSNGGNHGIPIQSGQSSYYAGKVIGESMTNRDNTNTNSPNMNNNNNYSNNDSNGNNDNGYNKNNCLKLNHSNNDYQYQNNGNSSDRNFCKNNGFSNNNGFERIYGFKTHSNNGYNNNNANNYSSNNNNNNSSSGSNNNCNHNSYSTNNNDNSDNDNDNSNYSDNSNNINNSYYNNNTNNNINNCNINDNNNNDSSYERKSFEEKEPATDKKNQILEEKSEQDEAILTGRPSIPDFAGPTFAQLMRRITPRKPEYESTFRITEFSDKSVRMFK